MCPLVIPSVTIERRMASRKRGFEKLVKCLKIKFPDQISEVLVDAPRVVLHPCKWALPPANRRRSCDHPRLVRFKGRGDPSSINHPSASGPKAEIRIIRSAPLVVAAPGQSHRNHQRKATYARDRGYRVAGTIDSRRQNRKDTALLFVQLINQIDLPLQILTHVILVATVALCRKGDKINPCRRGK